MNFCRKNLENSGQMEMYNKSIQSCQNVPVNIYLFSREFLFSGKSLREGPLFFPGGIAIGEKIVCMRKIAEINCLPQRCI